jgi:hypothetical protein
MAEQRNVLVTVDYIGPYGEPGTSHHIGRGADDAQAVVAAMREFVKQHVAGLEIKKLSMEPLPEGAATGRAAR